jgi:putative acetyltransferase
VGEPRLIIRPEAPGDFGAIAEVTEAAFGRPDEARLVEAIRASSRYVPELSLVGEREGEILGHLMLSYVDLEAWTVLELAPVSVRPDVQKSGIGSALINQVLAKAEARGEPLVLVLGHPSYYPRFGWRPSVEFDITPPLPLAPEVFMVKPLSEYKPHHRGRVSFEETAFA